MALVDALMVLALTSTAAAFAMPKPRCPRLMWRISLGALVGGEICPDMLAESDPLVGLARGLSFPLSPTLMDSLRPADREEDFTGRFSGSEVPNSPEPSTSCLFTL